ncbi:MAG: biopolymer transporter ExbD [Bacteroidia bacterium]|nr:biopolymer transporter ExbD [Bacteroidales bacterium]MDD3962072.1 biopolymer transporter ExbD [Bacteroidales bacterium]NCD41907.1 biopolymer transporter ExbD [Bacteroidia bacterium]HPE86023.1 biopolymer transporter ExbD [Bacteroidales bacterium]
MAKRITEINASSMADIAFLLLIFFLVTTTMDIDTGIARRLPPPLPENVDPPDVKDRNIFTVLVSKSDRLMIDGKPGDIRALKDQAKEFLANPANSIDLPEKEMKQIDYLGEVSVSKGIISLKNDRGTSYDMYIQVQDALTAAVSELRDELSMEKFGIKFTDLSNEDYIDAIKSAIPVSISEAEPENIGDN